MSIVQCSLNQIPIGKRCRVAQLNSTGSIRTRLQDIGMVQGTELIPLMKSCAGDPVAYLIRGTVIAIRNQDSSSILVEHSDEE